MELSDQIGKGGSAVFRYFCGLVRRLLWACQPALRVQPRGMTQTSTAASPADSFRLSAIRDSSIGANVFVTDSGDIVYGLPKLGQHKAVKGVAVYEWLVGSRDAELTGEELSSAPINYFTGKDPRNWKRDVPASDTVQFGEVYPGISF